MLLDKPSRVQRKADKRVYELVSSQAGRLKSCEQYHGAVFGALEKADSQIYELIKKEYARRRRTVPKKPLACNT